MSNNVVHFPHKNDLGKGEFSKEKQEVLIGRTRDLRKDNKEISSVQKSPIEIAREDIESLTKTKLKAKYELTYSSWRNMKQRRKTGGAIIKPEFEDFSSFLSHMGPRRNGQYTLDRIDNTNPAYGPGLCKWADKAEQANNRRFKILLTHAGECLTPAEWAKRTGQKADTMRARKIRGWTDSEAVTGKRVKKKKSPLEIQACVPMPWRGSDQEQVELERDYQEAQKRRVKKYANRYETYIVYLKRQFHFASIRVRRCTEPADHILPTHNFYSEDEYYSQFEVSGELEQIRELEAERDRIGELLQSVREEYEAFVESQRCVVATDEDKVILNFIQSNHFSE